jgi:phage terminase large subunit-like protein
MPWKPKHKDDFPSLGWDLLDWYRKYLAVPSGPMVGQPLELTDEQASFVVRFYRLAENGQRVYRRGVLRRPKGWGKSPLLAAMAIGELCGPVLFKEWDSQGEPVGVEHGSPWVQIAACSEDQTDNTYVALFEMLRESPAVDEFGLDVGITRIFLKGRPGRLEPVTASSGSREGQPVTFAVLDETHLWLPTNGGKRLAATIRRNVAKMGGSSVESTNAYVPGMKSVAEASESAKEKGQEGLVLDTGPRVEMSFEDIHKPKARKNLTVAYGDSWWVDLDRILADATDADTDPADALRFFWNVIVQTSDQAFDVELWDSLEKSKKVPKGATITLGFDGARFHDATGLVGTEVETGHQFVVGLWERPENVKEWEIDPTEVDEKIERTFEDYDVWRMYADPAFWDSWLIAWAGKYGDERVIEWDTRPPKKMAYTIRTFVTSQRAGELSHPGDERLTAHIANARKRQTNYRDEDGRRLWVIEKEHPTSPNKIDLAMAAVLSWDARMDYLREGGPKPPGEFFAFS